jgi:phosphosulfolactate phosphohydrolase-like enzyme
VDSSIEKYSLAMIIVWSIIYRKVCFGSRIGKEGFWDDVVMASEFDVSNAVPVLEEDRFVNGA